MQVRGTRVEIRETEGLRLPVVVLRACRFGGDGLEDSAEALGYAEEERSRELGILDRAEEFLRAFWAGEDGGGCDEGGTEGVQGRGEGEGGVHLLDVGECEVEG